MSARHVIIGDGLTAAEFAATAPLNAGDCLTIIGPEVASLGRGLAYRASAENVPWRYAYLLNSPSYAVDPDFAVWMAENRDGLIDCMSGRQPDWLSAGQPWIDRGQLACLNAPREIYGDFSARRAARALANLRRRGIRVELVAERALAIRSSRRENRFEITTTGGSRTIAADSIDVATGGPVNQQFDSAVGDRYFHTLFGNEQQIATVLGAHGSVACIGANATMLDALRFCQSLQHESSIRLTAVSLHAELPEPLLPSSSQQAFDLRLNGPYRSAAEFIRDVMDQKHEAMVRGYLFEQVRAGLRSRFMQSGVADFFADPQEARKLARPLYRLIQGGTRDSVLDFMRLQKNGSARLLQGQVNAVEQSGRSASVIYSDAAGRAARIDADVVINCAGPGAQGSFDALTSHMLAHGWIDRCPHSGGIVVGAGCRTRLDGIRYLGPAVTCIGDNPMPVPLYDALRLRLTVQNINAADACR